MARIAYLHDGTSAYDELLLEYLARKNTVYFLTFHQKPRFVPKRVVAILMQEPHFLFSDREWMEGPRMYILFLLRALLIRLNLRLLRPKLVLGCTATKYGFYSAIANAKPLVVIVWGSDVLVAPKRFFFFRFMAKYALRKADAVIVDSEVQKRAALKLGCSQNKILKFPWFDKETIHPMTSRQVIRSRLGWLDNIIVISTRNHEQIYGVQNLIEAVPDVLSQFSQTRFLLLGKGSLTRALEKRAKELQVYDYIRFMGSLSHEDTMSYLNAADINVSTSFSDGTSAALLEAMTLGVASVVTDIPGNKEWIENGWNGFLIPIKDHNALSEKLLFLIKNESIRKALADNARKTIAERVSWTKSSKDFSELLLQLMNKQANAHSINR